MSKPSSSNIIYDNAKTKKIDSPFAKYNSLGQLSCIICNNNVKNELLWNTHIISRQHLENKSKLKSKIESEQSKQKKEEERSKSLKGAFKRNNSGAETGEDVSLLKIEEDEIRILKKQKIDNEKLANEEKNEDFTKKKNDLNTKQALITELPEGFFDDRELDNQIRGVNSEQNLNYQYEEFKRMIQNEELKSDGINLKDDEIRDGDRDLEEVEELITRWKKIENLHQKRDELLKNKSQVFFEDKNQSNSESDDSDIDLDNVLDLSIRSKKRC